MKETPGATSLAYRASLFVLFLICTLAIFLFGSNYYKAFVTNGNVPYAAGLTAVFLIATMLLKRSRKFAKYWQIAYAFFVASAVSRVSVLFAGYNSTIVRSFGLLPKRSSQSNRNLELRRLAHGPGLWL